jgi:hypothetical protein
LVGTVCILRFQGLRMTFDGSDPVLAPSWRDEEIVATRRLAPGYPDRAVDAAPVVAEVLDKVPGEVFTAQHAAALFQTHIIADAMAQLDSSAMLDMDRPDREVHQFLPTPVLTPALLAADTLALSTIERASRRRIALTCLVAGAGLFFWAGLMAVRSVPRASGPELHGRDVLLPSVASRLVSDASEAEPAQLAEVERQLAMAERLVAEGSILAAREVLSDLVLLSEPRALFALAETFDPHMLAFWRVRVAPNAAEARRLYAAAGESGHIDATRRLDALP